jgi:hypothetical protein
VRRSIGQVSDTAGAARFSEIGGKRSLRCPSQTRFGVLFVVAFGQVRLRLGRFPRLAAFGDWLQPLNP